MSTQQPVIRVMRHEDIPAAIALKNLAGWNQLPLDWERFLHLEPEGCFLAEHEGTIVGTASTISYGDRFGWIGMVLVHPDMRGQGLGKRILQVCMDYLDSTGVSCIRLDATPMGKPLYEKLGFTDEYRIERWSGTGKAQALPAGVTELTTAMYEDVFRFDAPAYGAERGRALRRLFSEPTTRAAVVLGSNHSVAGYIAVRPGMNAAYIGPWVAESPEAAEVLWHWALAVIGPQPTNIDLVQHTSECAGSWAAAAGFTYQRPFTRMCRGINTYPGVPELQYSLMGPETG